MKKRVPFFLGLLLLVGYLTSLLANNDFSQKKATIPQIPTVTGEPKTTLQPKPTSVSNGSDLVLVKRVVDGDTIELETGQKLRYIGINTPETVDPRRAPQCFGQEASNKNKELVAGKKVRLEKDVSETDKFGRLLRYVYLVENGQETMVNDLLVKEGYAQVSTFPPDVKYQNLFLASQKEAQAAGVGLWSTCNGSKSSSPTTLGASSDCLIKGNLSSSGEKIYHLPGQKYYDQTVVDESKGEQWFCSETDAGKVGFRKAKL